MRMLMITLLASPLFAQAPNTSAPAGNAQNGRKLFENFAFVRCELLHGGRIGQIGHGFQRSNNPAEKPAVQFL